MAEVLAHIDFLDETIERLSNEIQVRERRFAVVLERFDIIPGVGPHTAEIIIAEVGLGVQRFPTAGHLAGPRGRSAVRARGGKPELCACS